MKSEFSFKENKRTCRLSKDFKTWCFYYQKWSEQYTEEKNTFKM